MLDLIEINQNKFLEKKNKAEQKKLGQYFTDALIAQYMSTLISKDLFKKDCIKFLDCGAGCGILTIATALYCLENGVKDFSATLYEIDKSVLVELNNNLDKISNLFTSQNCRFQYQIINEDFVVQRPDRELNYKFDISLVNPPYFKYSVKESKYSNATSDLFKGDPNIYASFISIVIASLDIDGEAIIISPRSYLNGLYFKGFRKYLLKQTDLQHIHIFKSRDKVFLNSEVLQENIIFKIKKANIQSPQIVISSSKSTEDLINSKIEKYPSNVIVDKSNDENIIRIPESSRDFDILKITEKLPSTFSKEGYFISTGPVVEHRTSDYLTNDHDSKSIVPLIKAHNVFIEGVVWSGKNQKDLSFKLINQFDKHLINNTKYLILKRFTSKDEKRRLVAGIYYPIQNSINLIGITNKLNFIGLKDEIIGDNELIGLSAYFNSTFMDNYYRCISGNTQVNATDVRILKFPNRNMIIKIGELVSKLEEINYRNIDLIVNNIIKINI